MNFDVVRVCNISQSNKYIFNDFHYLNISQSKNKRQYGETLSLKKKNNKKGSMITSSWYRNEKLIVTGFQSRGDETVLEIDGDNSR